MKRISPAVAALVAAGCLALGAAPATAKGSVSGATLTATPGVVTFTDSNAYETFTGCGYRASFLTTIVVTTPSAISWFGGNSDATGCINLSHNGFIDLPGTYTVQAWQDSARTGRSTMVAQTAFTVRAATG